MLASRSFCFTSRFAGALLIVLSILAFAVPAFAAGDQRLMADDGAQVSCEASAKDLTRISLVGDEFAGVSKIKTGDPASDLSVVNEPVREDIYLSVAEGFGRSALSFFGTSTSRSCEGRATGLVILLPIFSGARRSWSPRGRSGGFTYPRHP